jgi:uncharacterized protein YoxC
LLSIEAILLFVGIGIAVAAIALYLITVAAMLNHVSFTVGTVLVGVRSIAHQTAPIGGVLKEIVSDVQEIESALDNLVLHAEEAAEELEAGAPPPRRGVGRRSAAATS